MPPMSAPSATEIARSMRLQGFAGSVRAIKDPIVEPRWDGIRVVVAADGGAGVGTGVGAGERTAAMFDSGDLLDGHPGLVAAFRDATAATTDALVVEAWLTRQVASSDVGVYVGPDDQTPSTAEFLGSVLLGSRAAQRRERTEHLEAAQAARSLDPGDRLDLVVVDLLWLDGTSLLDVPLQERKRLLESVVPAGDLVRPGIHVRPPIDSWVGSWRAQGFGGLTFKAANSRYRPGEPATDWATTPMPRR